MSVRPIGNILDIWDTVLEPFDQDKEGNHIREGDDEGKGDEDNDETISLEEEEGVKAKIGKMEKNTH